MTFTIRTRQDPLRLAVAARSALRELDAELPVALVRSMEEVVSQATAPDRLIVVNAGSFAAVALLLAVLGIYGVMAHLVGQRTRELGIRAALGADRGTLVRLVLRRGLALSCAGVLAGLCGAFGVTRLMSAMLFGVSATDPLTFAAVPVLVLLAAFLACYFPARRGAQADPLSALRSE